MKDIKSYSINTLWKVSLVPYKSGSVFAISYQLKNIPLSRKEKLTNPINNTDEVEDIAGNKIYDDQAL